MTDVKRAVAFARECLKWKTAAPYRPEDEDGPYIIGDERGCRFDMRMFSDVQSALSEFLGKRFFIQINRGTSSLFKWSVIVGLQNRVGGPSMYDHAASDSDDMLDAVFDACVAAARLYPNA